MGGKIKNKIKIRKMKRGKKSTHGKHRAFGLFRTLLKVDAQSDISPAAAAGGGGDRREKRRQDGRL